MPKCLVIIPARGGSKRIPRKNIKPFLGKPIINYSIEAAIRAACFDEVMVSTDDREISEISAFAGASVPFLRSAKTADDYSTTADVVVEVLEEYKKLGKVFDFCCCLYPTAPFITGAKLKSAYDKIIATGADSVVPIVRFGFPILRSFNILDGLVKMNWPEFMTTRSQDLPHAFHDCGQYYFLRVDSFLKQKKLFTDFTVPFEMPESEVQDIDTEDDWKLAEIKYTVLLKNSMYKFNGIL